MDGLFVTGTGTEVGKTVVASAIARTLSDAGTRVAVFKPAVSGLDDYAASGEVPDHGLLRMAARSSQTDDEIAPYRFGPPVSPHLAAEIEDSPVDPERILSAASRARGDADTLVCEGVGGFLVPLTPDWLVRDLAVELGLPCVIASSPGLGTINHTLLTIEAIRAAGLVVAAVVLTPWPDEPGPMELSNLETVARLGEVPAVKLPLLDLGHPDRWPALRIPLD